MYLKVLVMEVKENYCLAMTQDGEILRIKRKKNMKIGDRIFILQEDLYQEEQGENLIFHRENKGRKIIWSVAAVAAAAAVFVGAAVYEHQLLNTSYALVSVDGAMSVQLELNKKGTVKKAISYDHTLTEAELKNLEGKEFQEAAEFLNFATDDQKQKWLVSYAFYQEETLKDAGFQKKLEAVFKEEAALCLKGDKEDIEKAEEENKTLGNYLVEKNEEIREKEEEKREERQKKEEEKEERREKEEEEKEEKREEPEEQEDVEEADEEERKQAVSVPQSKPVTKPDSKPQPESQSTSQPDSPVPQTSEPQDETWEPEENYEETYEDEPEEDREESETEEED